MNTLEESMGVKAKENQDEQLIDDSQEGITFKSFQI